MLGFDATGMSAREVYLDSVEICDILDKVYSTGKSVFSHKKLFISPGRRRYFNLNYLAKKNQLNQITGVLIIGIEATCRIDFRYSLNSCRKKNSIEIKKFSNLLNHNLPSFLGFVDPRTGSVIHLSERSARAIGKERREFIGRFLWECPWWESIPESIFRIKKILKKAIRGISSRFNLQYCSNLANNAGQLRWGFFQAVPISNNDGDVEWVAILGMDITERKKTKMRLSRSILERKQMEETLKMNEEKFQVLLNAIPQLVWTADSTGIITYLNKSWYEYCGSIFSGNLKQGKIVGNVHEQDVSHLLSHWEYAKRTGNPFSIEYRIRGKDGIYRWFLGGVFPVRNSSGRITQWIGSLTNIDEDKRARLTQEFLDRASSIFSFSFEFKNALKSLADLVVMECADLCIIDLLNQQGNFELEVVAHKDLGIVDLVKKCWSRYPVEMALQFGSVEVFKTGKPILIPEISADQALIQGARDKFHFDLLRKLKVYSLIVVPLQSSGRNFGTIKLIISSSKHQYNFKDLSMVRELASRSAVAIENLKMFNELKEAIKSRDTFLSIASHELKTPLTSLKLQAQIRSRAIKKGDLSRFTPEQLPKMFEEDQLQVNRLIRLVDNMLDNFCNQTGKLILYFEEFELGDLIRESISKFYVKRGMNSPSLNLRLHSTAKGSWDRFRLEQVFVNLLTNALNFGRDKPIDIEVGATTEKATFSVIDYGIGIEKKDQVRIFDRFERAVSAHTNPGLGLGLFISKKIVELHHGEIRVKSEPKMGSTFTVILPRTPPVLMDRAEMGY